MAIRNCLAAAFLLLISCFSYAADITANKTGTLSLVGTIVKGDTEKLRNVIQAQRFGLAAIVLDSPGGDVEEAIRMADLIKPLFLIAAVAPGKFCASACFFVWLAGNPRNAQSGEYVQRLAKQQRPQTGGVIGLHRPYRANIGGVANDQNQLMKHIQGYLEQQMLSRRLIDLMMSRPSNDIYWLTSADFDELGEYTPQIEELLIRKCDYVRITAASVARGLDQDKISRSIACANDVLTEAREKAWANMRK